MEESFTWQVKSKSGFSPKQRHKIAQLMYVLGGASAYVDPDFPGDDLLDSNGNELLDSDGNELESANF